MFSRRLFSFSLLTACILVLLLCQDCAGMRMWQFDPVSLDCTSSDESKISFDVRIVRVKRGEFAFTGTVEWNYDVDETTMIEGVSYRSSSGADDDYTPLPWTMSKQTIKQFINDVYKEITYKNLKDCSNLPDPEKAYPWPRGTYKFEKCVFDGHGLPDYLPEAYYKFAFKVTGEVEWNLLVVLKINKKLDAIG